jgi:hypothetical protein
VQVLDTIQSLLAPLATLDLGNGPDNADLAGRRRWLTIVIIPRG